MVCQRALGLGISSSYESSLSTTAGRAWHSPSPRWGDSPGARLESRSIGPVEEADTSYGCYQSFALGGPRRQRWEYQGLLPKDIASGDKDVQVIEGEPPLEFESQLWLFLAVLPGASYLTRLWINCD